jgi:hypothetical protein
MLARKGTRHHTTDGLWASQALERDFLMTVAPAKAGASPMDSRLR